eukprot:m.64518 g.64518  ORF g.64518 m.64518 type:complete len:203 (-) comp12529_c0_seq1:175-783(-)
MSCLPLAFFPEKHRNVFAQLTHKLLPRCLLVRRTQQAFSPAFSKALALLRDGATEIQLYKVPLAAHEVEELARALVGNTTLRWLNLNHTGLGPREAMLLARALEHNRTLTELYMSGNSIGCAGALAFAAVLESASALTTLALAANRIGRAGGHALAAVLACRTAPLKLHVDMNPFDSALQNRFSELALAAALRRGSSGESEC